MKKIKIGIDLDDTIWEFQSKFNKFYNSKFGTDYKLEDMKSYSYEETFKITKEKTIELLDEFSKTDSFSKLPLIDGVMDFLEKIEEDYEVYFITARGINRKDQTLECFYNHFGREEKIHFVGSGSEHEGKSKGEVCLELGIEYMVDDHVQNLLSCHKFGIKSFLINQPWNKNFKLLEGMVRVDILSDCLNYLEVKN